MLSGPASIAQLVSIPGSLVGGFLMEKFGPRKLVLITLPLLTLSWFAVVYAVYMPFLLILARTFQGLINSILCTTAYSYACEIGDKKRRGFLTASVDTMFSMGFLVTYIIGGFSKWNHFGLFILVASVLPCFVCVYFVPESPVWLFRHGNFDKATVELKRIRKQEEAEMELIMYEKKAEEETKFSNIENVKLLKKKQYSVPVLAASVLVLLKEGSGQYAIVLFVFQIFQIVNSSLSVYSCSLIVGITRLASNIVSCILLSRIPRKPLIVIPSLISSVSLGILGLYFYKDSWNTSPEIIYLPLALLIVFMVCYGIGIGPVSWLLAAEIQPSSVRNIGTGISRACFCLAQWFIAASFERIKNSIGLHWCFWMYSTGCFSTGIFVLICLPETKGKTLTEIEDYWSYVES